VSGNRPSLADAFAPVAPRGAKLEGMLAPKRRRIEEKPAAAAAAEPVDPALLTAVPAPATEPEPTPVAEPTAEPGPSATPKTSTAGDEPIAAPRPAAAPEPAPSPTTAPQQAAKRTAGPAPANTRTKASDAVPGAPRNVGVYLAPQLLTDVKEAVHLQRITYADLLIDAFEAVDDALIAREFEPETVLTSSGMPRRAVRRRGSAGIQIQVRLDDGQIAWLDDKVVEFDAPSRSALVSAVYKLHLESGPGAGE
jgi:outer membrane biosynthesis protein TonB